MGYKGVSTPIHRALGQPFGTLVRKSEVARFIVTETSYEAGTSLPAHLHSSPYVCFVLSGSFYEQCGSHSRRCEPFTAIGHPMGEIHSDRFEHEPVRCLNIELASSDELLSSLLQHPVEAHGGEAAMLCLKLRTELSDRDEFSVLAAEALALELLVTLSRGLKPSSAPSPPHWLVELRRSIDADPMRHAGLGALAATAGVHASHLARAFRRHFACTLGEYARRRKIDLACHALATTRQPIAEIALECGFTDQSHLTRTFRRMNRGTPAGYRRMSARRIPGSFPSPRD